MTRFAIYAVASFVINGAIGGDSFAICTLLIMILQGSITYYCAILKKGKTWLLFVIFAAPLNFLKDMVFGFIKVYSSSNSIKNLCEELSFGAVGFFIVAGALSAYVWDCWQFRKLNQAGAEA